jgi:rhodanese-related sulfurtransferase
MGRFTIMDWLHVSTGVVVVGITLMALIAFYFSELAEQSIGKMNLAQFGNWRYGAAAATVLVAAVVLFIGQPTNADRWNAIADKEQPRLDERAVYAHPAEILHLMEDPKLIVYMIDVRSEADFNEFHILDSHHVPVEDILDAAPDLHSEPANTVFVVLSNDEVGATEAWRLLVAESVPNVYVLEGGINGWIDTFSDNQFKVDYHLADHPDDAPGYRFTAALGSRYPAADPNPDVFTTIEYESKVKLQVKRGPSSGGCG